LEYKVTGSMERAIGETERRREKQRAYNQKHGITPATIRKNIDKGMRADLPESAKAQVDPDKIPAEEIPHLIRDLTGQMELASQNLEFEKAADLRDLLKELEQKSAP
jgi:excinuclease ABC subunit B